MAKRNQKRIQKASVAKTPQGDDSSLDEIAKRLYHVKLNPWEQLDLAYASKQLYNALGERPWHFLRFVWTLDKALPRTVHKRQVIPCFNPECRRFQMDNGGQAVVKTNISDGLVYFRCKACGHRWKLPIEEG